MKRRIWISSGILSLALVVMIGCAPALSSPTDQERSPNPLTPSVEGSASGESRVFEIEPPTSGETETVPGFSLEQVRS